MDKDCDNEVINCKEVVTVCIADQKFVWQKIQWRWFAKGKLIW